MDNNDKYQKYASKVNDIRNLENKSFKLRDIHMDVENIYEDIKKNKSSFIYKTIYYLLFGISALSFIVHIIMYGFDFGMLFLVLLIIYFFYFTYNIKSSIKDNIKTKKLEKIDPENPEFLKFRIQYISEGIQVTHVRAEMLRNFFIIFFPLMAFTLIDILKGPLTTKSYFVTFVVSFLLGGVFWFYYFRNDITDIQGDIEELQELKNKI